MTFQVQCLWIYGKVQTHVEMKCSLRFRFCVVDGYHYFGGTCCLYLEDAQLKLDAAGSSETSGTLY
jgi:hypothetical protein